MRGSRAAAVAAHAASRHVGLIESISQDWQGWQLATGQVLLLGGYASADSLVLLHRCTHRKPPSATPVPPTSLWGHAWSLGIAELTPSLSPSRCTGQAFDAQRSSPALTDLLQRGGLEAAGKRVLVPGCGR